MASFGRLILWGACPKSHSEEHHSNVLMVETPQVTMWARPQRPSRIPRGWVWQVPYVLSHGNSIPGWPKKLSFQNEDAPPSPWQTSAVNLATISFQSLFRPMSHLLLPLCAAATLGSWKGIFFLHQNPPSLIAELSLIPQTYQTLPLRSLFHLLISNDHLRLKTPKEFLLYLSYGSDAQ